MYNLAQFSWKIATGQQQMQDLGSHWLSAYVQCAVAVVLCVLSDGTPASVLEDTISTGWGWTVLPSWGSHENPKRLIVVVLSHLDCLTWVVSAGLSHLDCLDWIVSRGLFHLDCLAWIVSPGLSHLVCLMWIVSPGLFHLDCLTWIVSPRLFHLDCLTWFLTWIVSPGLFHLDGFTWIVSPGLSWRKSRKTSLL